MKLLTPKQVGRRLDISERSVLSLIASGQLAYVDVSVPEASKKPRRRISEKDLNAFIETRRKMNELVSISDKRRKLLDPSVLRLL